MEILAQCHINLLPELRSQPIKVVQAGVEMSFEITQSANAPAAPAQIVILGSPENQAKVLRLIGMQGLPDAALAKMLSEKHPELATDEKGSAATVRTMILEELMDMQDGEK